jgi:ribosome-binding factor A
MTESKRQKQVAGLIEENMNEIFQHLGLTMIDGGMVSISAVKVTPDLLEARIYLSFFRIKDNNAALKKIEDRAWEIKQHLSEKVKHQLRRIPVIQYFIDDTLDYVFKMEELFKKINDEKKPKD